MPGYILFIYVKTKKGGGGGGAPAKIFFWMEDLWTPLDAVVEKMFSYT